MQTSERHRWKERVRALLFGLSPDAFERLTRALLERCGIVDVAVTGRPHDGGIDGRGVVKLSGLLSVPVVFQCKRCKGRVGAREVRDLRGAMAGRAERALLITTGRFTAAAKREATRAGVTPIDLLDGDALIEKLKELSLGVYARKFTVEDILIDTDWFEGL